MGLEDTKYVHMFGALTTDSKTLLQQTMELNILSAYTERKSRRSDAWRLNQKLDDRIIRYEEYYNKVFHHYYYPKLPGGKK